MQIHKPLKKKTKPPKAVFYIQKESLVYKRIKNLIFTFFYIFYIEITLKNPIYKASFYLLPSYYHAHDS